MLELTDNIYNQRQGRGKRQFKLWRSAGLMLTYKCNCRCEFCYYCCSPDSGGLMKTQTALNAWQGLVNLAGDSAKVHITGGEPFLYYDRLLEILKQAKQAGLGRADMVETNGFWGGDRLAKEKLREIEPYINKLKISCDPFHQQYVNIRLVQKMADLAADILGEHRVMIRWEKYLQDSSLTFNAEHAEDAEKESRAGLAPPNIPVIARSETTKQSSILNQKTTRLLRCDRNDKQYMKLFLQSLKDYPCRFTGRAAGQLAQEAINAGIIKSIASNCANSFLAAKGVHIDPFGNVFSGTCSGIIVGNVETQSLEDIWRNFDPQKKEIVNCLFNNGPMGLLEEAEEKGYQKLEKYASKCHLCTHIRTFLLAKGLYGEVVGPKHCYEI